MHKIQQQLVDATSSAMMVVNVSNDYTKGQIEGFLDVGAIIIAQRNNPDTMLAEIVSALQNDIEALKKHKEPYAEGKIKALEVTMEIVEKKMN
jgi:hypothetical protein